MAAAALSRAALAASPLLDRGVADTARRVPRPAIPRCLREAIRNRRRWHQLQQLAAVQRPSTTTTTSPSSASSLDAEASELRHALSNRASSSPDPLLLDRARDLALSLAAARKGGGAGGAAGRSTPEAAAFLDALGGAVARALTQNASSPSPSSSSSSSSSSISSLEATARLVKAYAQSGHRTLATSELAKAAVKQACRALTATTTAGSLAPPPPSPPPPVPVFAAAASIARSVACLGIYPGARLMEALSASAAAFAGKRGSGGGGGGGGGSSMIPTDGDSSDSGSGKEQQHPRLSSRLPASAVVDWLCAAAAARHALPRRVGALAATARFNPIQAAAAAAALASLGSGSSGGGGGGSGDARSSSPPPFPTLVSTIRSRVAGSPRGGVPPRAAVAAAWALASWGQLDAAAAAALAEHAEAGVAVAVEGSSSPLSSSEASSIAASSSPPNPSLLGKEDLVSLWGALRAAGWRAARAAEGGSGGAEAAAAPAAAGAPPASARATRAASAARAAACTAAAELNARGPPREIAQLSERLQLLLRGGVCEARVLAPSADDCLLWRVECRGHDADDDDGAPAAPAVALVALSPPDNVSNNSPAVALGLASVELNAAAAAAKEAGSPASLREGGLLLMLFPGAGGDELEALAAAVEEALSALPGPPLSQL